MNKIDRYKILIRYLINLGVIESQKDLGVKMGYSNPSAFSQVINGKTSEPKLFANKLANLYPSLNLNWLLTGEGSMILGEENATQQKQEGLRHGRFIRVTTHHVQDEENVNYINIDNITSFHLKEGSILINTCDGKRHKITDNVSELFEALL